VQVNTTKLIRNLSNIKFVKALKAKKLFFLMHKCNNSKKTQKLEDIHCCAKEWQAIFFITLKTFIKVEAKLFIQCSASLN